MKNPNPVNLQSSAEVRERGWQAESRDAEGHLISCHAPIEADDQGIAEWIVECTSRGETVTFWPTNGDVSAPQPPPPSTHVAPNVLNSEPDGWICEDEFTLEADQYDEWVAEGLDPRPFFFAAPFATTEGSTDV